MILSGILTLIMASGLVSASTNAIDSDTPGLILVMAGQADASKTDRNPIKTVNYQGMQTHLDEAKAITQMMTDMTGQPVLLMYLNIAKKENKETPHDVGELDSGLTLTDALNAHRINQISKKQNSNGRPHTIVAYGAGNGVLRKALLVMSLTNQCLSQNIQIISVANPASAKALNDAHKVGASFLGPYNSLGLSESMQTYLKRDPTLRALIPSLKADQVPVMR
ncbi:hypothetical protein EBZ35_06275 [bacterium]|nr:hypothetical protein [bacterium]